MAELGAVASAIGIASFGVQVADSVLKLKDFWDRIREAPEEIQHILEEIDILSLVLSEIGQSSDKEDLAGFAPASTANCLELCRRGSNILSAVVADLESAIGKKRKIGSVKAALKKGTLERLGERLENTQFMLMLSNQVYSDLVRTALTENFLEIKLVKARRKRLLTRYHIPNWLFFGNLAAEITAQKSLAGWNFSIQTYNIRPSDSIVFELAGSGDVAGMQKLFSSGDASPFDRDENGLTLLDDAAFNHELEVCKLLQNEGADLNVSKDQSAVFMACKSGYKDDEKLFSVIRLLSQTAVLEDPFDFDDELQKTLLHCTAWNLGEHYSDSFHFSANDEEITVTKLLDPFWKYGTQQSNVLALVRDLVKGGSNVHGLARTQRRGGRFTTPLLEVFAGYFYYSEFDLYDCRDILEEYSTLQSNRRIKSMPAYAWLELAGLDLEEYGRQEISTHLKNEVKRDFEYHTRQTVSGEQVRVIERDRLVSFTFEPKYQDWEFWFATETNDSLIEF